jgi:sugar O-acyltransferase (sialic acid O-acetyltransferase NeuD family)
VNLYIVGAGGLGREVLEYARDAFRGDEVIQIAGFLDDNPKALEGLEADARVLGPVAEAIPGPDDRFVLAVANPRTRRALTGILAARGARFLSVIHPSAWISPTARLGEGCVVCPFAFVGAGARLGPHVVLNTYASVGHDADVGEGCVFSPYAVVNGNVVLGPDVFMGTQAVVILGRRVGARAKIAAGSVVTQAVPEDALAAGNPARSRVMSLPVP